MKSFSVVGGVFMNKEKIQILFEQIGLDEKEKEMFQDLSLVKVKVDEKNCSWTFVLESPCVLNLEQYQLLEKKTKEAFFNIKKVQIEITPKYKNYDLLQDYYEYALNQVRELLVYALIFKDCLLWMDGKYVIESTNIEEEKQVKEILPKLNYLLELYGFDIEIGTYLNLEKEYEFREGITNEIKQASTQTSKVEVKEEKQTTGFYQKSNDGKSQYRRQKKEDNPNVILGRTIEDKSIQMHSIVGETDNITVEGYVFGVDYFESSKTDFKIITLKLTDYSDSIYCKVFSRGDEDYQRLKKALKSGNWYMIRGYTKNDTFSKELVLNARDICILEKEAKKVEDLAPVKRVELHAHTMMSQMDGITKLDLGKHTCELVERAIKMGYRGVAITDHNGCQAFPISFGIIKGHNKSIRKKIKEKIESLEAEIETEEDVAKRESLMAELEKVKEEKKNPPNFKGLYGAELTLVEDMVNIVVRPTDDDLLHNTYVVFDTETTGFNAGGADQMIEIGAVKIKDGQIIDRFDELIDPKRHIPDKITELTCITDDMVRGRKSEEEVTIFLWLLIMRSLISHLLKWQ